MSGDETLAILVGGGPAPGINGVIASATIEARNSGLRVLGIYEGYRHLVRGDTSHVVELEIDDVSRLHFTGGSMLRTSRTNPAKDEESLRRCVRSLTLLGVRYLIAIGGDDTTFGAARIASETKGRIGVATVPKTIDNDLPLPDNAPTFGFETARAVGSAIVENLMEDARTASRWYLAVTMGRKSGALALGICKAAGATIAVIPEEFADGPITLQSVVDTLVGAIVKRLATGADHGVAVVAEGIAERIAPEELAAVTTAARDAYGHVRLADVPLGSVLRDAVRVRLAQIGLDTTVVPKDIGYELRSAKPIPFDAEYTRTLGYGAVRYLLSGRSGSLIALAGGRINPVTLEEMLDPATGRIRVRLVDVTTESYEVARKYMIRLEAPDFTEPRLSRLAAQTSLGPDAFAAEFSHLVA
ncbi:MAG: 6-phosphofructokinase [Candidatus Eremiobacteraeota bacterium]|nr:6-phosphofructokinase [Candidatus Eremiobacteraeota bacterium]